MKKLAGIGKHRQVLDNLENISFYLHLVDIAKFNEHDEHAEHDKHDKHDELDELDELGEHDEIVGTVPRRWLRHFLQFWWCPFLFSCCYLYRTECGVNRKERANSPCVCHIQPGSWLVQ